MTQFSFGCLDCRPKCMNGNPAVWFGRNITIHEMDGTVNETMENGATEILQEITVRPTVCVNVTELVNATDGTEEVNFTITNCTDLHGDVEHGYWECECPSFNTTGERLISIPFGSTENSGSSQI